MTAGQHAAPRFRRFRVWPRPAALVTEPAAETSAQAPAGGVDYGTSCEVGNLPTSSAQADDPGWDGELHDATSPGLPLPAPDDTMVWRVPGLDGGPGMVIPPATLETPEGPLPARVPGAGLPEDLLVPALRTEPADRDILREVRDALRALPGDPAPVPARPVSWLRVIEDDGRQAHEALDGPPEFAGTVAMPDGTPVAGLVLGCHGRGTWILDTVDPAVCEALIAAATEMRDALVAARDGGDESEEAA